MIRSEIPGSKRLIYHVVKSNVAPWGSFYCFVLQDRVEGAYHSQFPWPGACHSLKNTWRNQLKTTMITMMTIMNIMTILTISEVLRRGACHNSKKTWRNLLCTNYTLPLWILPDLLIKLLPSIFTWIEINCNFSFQNLSGLCVAIWNQFKRGNQLIVECHWNESSLSLLSPTFEICFLVCIRRSGTPFTHDKEGLTN